MTLIAARPRVAVVVFPGTWSERDFEHVAESVLGWDARLVWHAETDLGDADAVVLPGGFAHGDHLRTGAIARFSPVMAAVEAFAAEGGPVIGSCNGFQVLTEAGLLPGALMRNDHLEFRCDWQWLRVEHPGASPPWLGDVEDGALIRLPISHGEGRYVADPARSTPSSRPGASSSATPTSTVASRRRRTRMGRSARSPGSSTRAGNVLGLMPHPERAAEPRSVGTDGLVVFRSLERWLQERPAAAERRL
jgi:phosphoribosylformylglycinamidine synthase subunit PurQ / glutaminase